MFSKTLTCMQQWSMVLKEIVQSLSFIPVLVDQVENSKALGFLKITPSFY